MSYHDEQRRCRLVKKMKIPEGGFCVREKREKEGNLVIGTPPVDVLQYFGDHLCGLVILCWCDFLLFILCILL